MLEASASACKTMTLNNGLQVHLDHQPGLKRSAAFLRVAAGSHDVARQWPGLAHFLEHLFFLGTERFAGDEALMSFVQRQGGLINASTGDRHTDYFFEIAPSAFAGALERLCDMLAQPRLDLTAQGREREVIHAEFIAWCRDSQARHQQSLIQGLAAHHPLRGFHAGNRYSLPVPRATFQQALRDHLRTFYQAGQMTLHLAGPQPLEHLSSLVHQAGCVLPAGTRQPQATPPPLLNGPRRPAQRPDPSRLNLLFTWEQAGPALPQAIDFLGTWLSAQTAGGLLAELRQRGLAHEVSLRTLYRFGQQAVIDIEFKLTDAGQQDTASVAHSCFDWLAFFRRQDCGAALRDEYARLRRRRRQVAGALERARQASEGLANELTEAGWQTVRALLEQLRAQQLLHPLDLGAPTAPATPWRLPPSNPFLAPAPSLTVTTVPEPPPALQHGSGVGAWQDVGAVQLRWRLDTPGAQRRWRQLTARLGELTHQARQAGVELTFDSLGHDGLLSLTGLRAPLPAVLERALHVIGAPLPISPEHGASAAAAPALMPIRELLKRLPHFSIDPAGAASKPAATSHDPWATARWDGLAVGFTEHEAHALHAALQQMPGTPARDLAGVPTPRGERTWVEVATPSSEQALLLFCPMPHSNVADEAAWRVLGQRCQTAFYQRLRVELQLGYAVFAGVRQMAGRTGLLFGVQSPGTPLAALIGHVEAFIEHLAVDPQTLGSMGRELAERLQVADMEPTAALHWLWQAREAGHDIDGYADRLQRALLDLQPATLEHAVRDLRQARGGRLCLANGPPPAAGWHCVEGSLPNA